MLLPRLIRGTSLNRRNDIAEALAHPFEPFMHPENTAISLFVPLTLATIAPRPWLAALALILISAVFVALGGAKSARVERRAGDTCVECLLEKQPRGV